MNAADTKPFEDCLDVFAKHEYKHASNLALNLFQKRRYFWIIQLILISLERIGNDRALSAFSEVAYQSFSEHPWNLALIDVSLGLRNADELRSATIDAGQHCQLDFYEASRCLTLGDRPAAVAGFLASALSGVQRPEQYLATCECANPEPADLILERVTHQATQPSRRGVSYDALTCARSVLQLLRDEELQEPSIALPCLEIIMMTLKGLQPGDDVAYILSQLQELYNERDARWAAANPSGGKPATD